MGTIRAGIAGLPLLGRWAVMGAIGTGAAGAVAGLIIGLLVHAPTAPFAVFELGLPAAVVGGLAGLAAGVLVALVRRIRQLHQESL